MTMAAAFGETNCGLRLRAFALVPVPVRGKVSVIVPDCGVAEPGDNVAGADGTLPVAGVLPPPPHPARRNVPAKSAET
jgi:hypothetical protein